MISYLIFMGLTWYLTKLYYTHKPFFNLNEDESNLGRIACYSCGDVYRVEKMHLRNPYYCMRCA